MADDEEASQVRRKAWFDRAFDRQYLASYAHRNASEAQEQWAAAQAWLALKERGQVLDLACGAGRHLQAMRRASPHLKLVGLDRSRDLLAAAQKSFSMERASPEPEPEPVETSASPAASSSCTWIRADMRWLPFADRSFDAITQWFTAFGYFEDREEDRKVLLEVQRILRPGGRHLLDTLDPDFVRATLVPQSEREVPGGRLLEERRLEDDRVVKSIRFVPSHSQEPSESWHESVRLWEAEELAELYRSVGMRVLHAFGHVDGSPRSAETRRLVFVAERLPEGEA